MTSGPRPSLQLKKHKSTLDNGDRACQFDTANSRRSDLKLGGLVFVDRGKTQNHAKILRARTRASNKLIQLSYFTNSEIRSQTKLLKGLRLRH